MDCNAVISIVIPVYGTERYVGRCLESLLSQTYKNLEIIIVDDCSPDDSIEIISQYALRDKRIKYIKHEENKGLFRVRITGAEQATGKYITFVDSDDYVTIDYYRNMIESAEKNNSDIVIGRTIFQNKDGYRYIKNLHNENFSFDILKGEDVRNSYFSQRGLCFSWHTVWNKIYRKDLWDKCFPYYKKMDTHIIMTEDIAFSSLLFYNAQVVTTIKNNGYFYCENENIPKNKMKFERYQKNMEDIKLVFDFVEEYLNEVNAKGSIRSYFLDFRKHYSRKWRKLGESIFFANEKRQASILADKFLPDFNEYPTKDSNFLDSIDTNWNSGLEDIKQKICSNNYEYISFNVFDTIIMKPFYKKEDLFILMNKKFQELIKCSTNFVDIRMQSEADIRKVMEYKNPSFQEVTIDEIYEYMCDCFNIRGEVSKQLKEEEKRLEVLFCSQRKSVKELFDVAKIAGKKIIFIADSVLDLDTIKSILIKNDYKDYVQLFVSSELRVSKNSGDMFKKVLESLNISPQHILHIGSDCKSDIINPNRYNIKTAFIPNAIEVFQDKTNSISGITTNNCSKIGEFASGIIQDKSKLIESFGYRTMLALISNYYFDNPYISFNKNTDFNSSPYFIGFYTLGMHMIGLSKWIIEQSRNMDYNNICFMSTDGYLPMKVFNTIKSLYKDIPEANYINISKNDLLPAMIVSEQDFYNLPIEYYNHTPETIIELLKFCSNNYNISDLKEYGFIYDKLFNNRFEFNHFIRYYIDNIYDKNKHKEAFEKIKEYYLNLNLGKYALFSLDHIGHTHNAICNMANKDIDSFMLYSSSVKHNAVKEFKVNTFYDFSPCIDGFIREYIFSDLSLHTNNDFLNSFSTNLIQKGSIDFAELFVKTFNEYQDCIDFKSQEISLPFESYFVMSKDIDLQVLKTIYIKDFFYYPEDKINFYEFIKDIIKKLPINTGLVYGITREEMIEKVVSENDIFIKAITYGILDEKLFGKHFKNHVGNFKNHVGSFINPKLLSIRKYINHMFEQK